MARHKFWKEDETNPDICKIKTLRQEASSLMSINNSITKEIWDIDQKLSSTAANSQKQELLKEKQELNNILKNESYPEKIMALKKEIYDLEVQTFGRSDILDESPKSSNSLIYRGSNIH